MPKDHAAGIDLAKLRKDATVLNDRGYHTMSVGPDTVLALFADLDHERAENERLRRILNVSVGSLQSESGINAAQANRVAKFLRRAAEKRPDPQTLGESDGQ